MSLIQEVFDRLSGVAGLRERMNDIRATLDEQLRVVLDHERRLARVEAQQAAGPKRGLSKPS